MGAAINIAVPGLGQRRLSPPRIHPQYQSTHQSNGSPLWDTSAGTLFLGPPEPFSGDIYSSEQFASITDSVDGIRYCV
jgi:hypothetical protein